MTKFAFLNTRRLFVALFVIALFTMAVRETLDPDMWWHLRTGEYILQNGIPVQDVFTFTVPQNAWVTHEWLSQLIMWLVYLAGGLPGLILFFAALIALTYWLLYLACAGRPYLTAFVVLLAAVTSAIVWGARPQIFNLLLTAVFVLIVERVKNGQWRVRALWWLPLLTLVWANLHSGYLLGVVLLGTYAVGDLAQRWLAVPTERTLGNTAVTHLFGAALASFLAAAVNPSGIELWLYPFLTLGSGPMQAYIQEWHSPDFHQTYFWPFAAMLALGVLGWVFNKNKDSEALAGVLTAPDGAAIRRSTTAQVAITELLLFLGTGAAGLLSARHIPLFAIVAAPILARSWLSVGVDPEGLVMGTGKNVDKKPSGSLFVVLNWLLLMVAVGTAVVWSITKISGNEAAIAARYPVAAVDYLEASGLDEARGYNSYNWGGYLIWRGVPVFVDGRADVYGDPFLLYYRRTFDVRPGWQEPLDEYNVDYVLMEYGSPLTAVLAASPDWTEVYADELAQIFIRAK